MRKLKIEGDNVAEQEDMKICEMTGCNEQFVSRPCRNDRFCLYHQLKWEADYDNFVDPKHQYHAHGPEGDFVPER